MSLIKDLTTGLIGTLFTIFISPLPVSLFVKSFFSLEWAIVAHIVFVVVFHLNRQQIQRKYQQISAKEVTEQFISMLIRTYCMFFATIALLFGAAQGAY